MIEQAIYQDVKEKTTLVAFPYWLVLLNDFFCQIQGATVQFPVHIREVVLLEDRVLGPGLRLAQDEPFIVDVVPFLDKVPEVLKTLFVQFCGHRGTVRQRDS